MAASGAHITSTTQQDDDRPSIFEVLAQESLVYTLKPALQHLLRVLAENNPSRYGKLYAYCEEVYLGLHLILEQYYLKHYSASFSENFYGMKRIVTAARPPPDDSEFLHGSNRKITSDSIKMDPIQSSLYRNLPDHIRAKSLVFLVLVPYFKSKCDGLYETLRDTQQYQASQKNLRWRLGQILLKIYPLFHFVYEFTMLASQLGYIFKKSSVHSPFLTWAEVILQNLTEDDISSSSISKKEINVKDKSWLEILQGLSGHALGGVALALSSGLSVGIFFLQFLEWWYTSPQHTTAVTAMPNPPPPKRLPDVMTPNLNIICPLCQKVRSNDTALSVSGYVFCYSCISSFVKEERCCPVTRYPATSDNLIRLFLPES